MEWRRHHIDNCLEVECLACYIDARKSLRVGDVQVHSWNNLILAQRFDLEFLVDNDRSELDAVWIQ